MGIRSRYQVQKLTGIADTITGPGTGAAIISVPNTVKPQYNVPRFNVSSQYNVEKIFTLPIDPHVSHPRYNVDFNVELKIFGPQRNVISRFHCKLKIFGCPVLVLQKSV